MPTLLKPRIAGANAGAARNFAQWSLVGTLLLLVSASAVASLPSQRRDEPLAILFPPWMDGQQALARSLTAGYRIIRVGRLDTVIVVAPRPAAKPLPPGAWLALALTGLAGCLDSADASGARS